MCVTSDLPVSTPMYPAWILPCQTLADHSSFKGKYFLFPGLVPPIDWNIKILPDYMSPGNPKSVIIKLKSFKLQPSFIWPSPLRRGEVDEWLMHKIYMATDTQHTHADISRPLYEYTHTHTHTHTHI